MKVEVNVPRTWAYVVLIGLLLGSGMFAFVMAYNAAYTGTSEVSKVAAFGHSPDEIEVNLGTGTGDCSGKHTLQYAIDKKCLGGGTTGGGGSLTVTECQAVTFATCALANNAYKSCPADRPILHQFKEWQSDSDTVQGCVKEILCCKGTGANVGPELRSFTNMEVYDDSIVSSQKWPKTGTVPTGVTKVYVRAWGGGGGGGSSGSTIPCIAGASGAYGEGIYIVAPGNTYDVVVGSGGNGGMNGQAGSPGGSSSFGSFLTVGLTATGAQNSIDASSPTAIGGGNAPNGGSGGLTTNSLWIYADTEGVAPGGGGGADCSSGLSAHIGSNGANGRVIVWW